MQPVYGDREHKRTRSELRREAFWAIVKDLAVAALGLAALVVACVALGSRP